MSKTTYRYKFRIFITYNQFKPNVYWQNYVDVYVFFLFGNYKWTIILITSIFLQKIDHCLSSLFKLFAVSQFTVSLSGPLSWTKTWMQQFFACYRKWVTELTINTLVFSEQWRGQWIIMESARPIGVPWALFVILTADLLKTHIDWCIARNVK